MTSDAEVPIAPAWNYAVGSRSDDVVRGGIVSVVTQLADAGLGLAYEELRLQTTTVAWVVAGEALRASVADALRDFSVEVEQIGSSSVVELLAKPIVDLAVGLGEDQELEPVRCALEGQGWIYRGDAGDDGGHVLVLEDRPWHRVAHAHVVPLGGYQWGNYLRLRDLLRESPAARERYAAVKRRLLAASGRDRSAYTIGKADIVESLIAPG
jgi:GrpB-like predicted nucleotidyltransferase (UPF0157 family)